MEKIDKSKKYFTIWMWTKKLLLVLSIFLLLFVLLSGCILEESRQNGSIYRLKEWEICSTEGFPSLFLDFDSTKKIVLKTYKTDGNMIDNEYFFGGGNTTINIGSYRETIYSKNITLKIFDYNEKSVLYNKKNFSFNGPDLQVKNISYNVWENQDKISLIEMKIEIYNHGDIPVYPENIKLNYRDKFYNKNIYPSYIPPDSYETIYSFIFIEEIQIQDSFYLEILDKNFNILYDSNFSFDDINYCETAVFTKGLESKLFLPMPEFLYSFYNGSEKLIVDDYAAYVFDKYDEEYIDLFLDLFENIYPDNIFNSFSDPQKINKLAYFVQNLNYIPDYEEGEEETEDPQYPIETLFRNNCTGGGDCEDKAILIGNILKNMGYNISLIKIPDHMAVGVNLGGNILSDYDYYIDNYYFLDTTPQKLGEVFSKYKNYSKIDIFPINDRSLVDHYWKDKTITIFRDSNNKKEIKVEIYIENYGDEKAKDLNLKSIFYTPLNIKLEEESFLIDDLDAFSKTKKVICVEVPKRIECIFDTRLFMGDDLISTRSSNRDISS